MPDANNAIIIPNGMPNYPILDVDAGAGNLTMGSATSITLNGFLFAMNGSLTNVVTGATIDASALGSELYMSSASAQSIPADFLVPDVANFTVENTSGVTINSEMNIIEILNIKEGNLITNDYLNLICSFTPTRKTAQLDELRGSITGNVTVEQCFPARRAFRLVSSSTTTTTSIHENWQEDATNWNDDPSPNNDISDSNSSGYGTHITGVSPNPTQDAGPATPNSSNNGLDWQPSGDASMFAYNSANQNWDMILTTNASATLTAGEAYRLMIRGDRSINLQSNATAPTNTRLRSFGTIVKGPIPVPLAINQNEFALVGNPFHSNIDMRSVLSNAVNLNQSFAVWDPTLGGTPVVGQGGGRGAFVTVNATTNLTNNSSSEMKRFVQPYQAFFVSATNSNPSLSFRESDKAVTENQVDVFSDMEDTFINFLLYDQLSFDLNDTPDDGLRINFSVNYSNEVNHQDAPKFENIDENLARVEGNLLLSLENRAMPVDNEELVLFINKYRTNEYLFKIELGDFSNELVYLKDEYTNELHLLNTGQNIITFSVNATIPESLNNSRFSVLFETSPLSTPSFQASSIDVYPNPSSDFIYVINQNSKDYLKALTLFDLSGRRLVTMQLEANSSRTSVNVASLASGIYLLQIETENSSFTQKVIVE